MPELDMRGARVSEGEHPNDATLEKSPYKRILDILTSILLGL